MAHGAACRLRTKDPVLVDRLATNYRLAAIEPRDMAMLDFAVAVAEASDRITEADLAALRVHGWTDEDILHITEVAAMFSFTGRLANTLGWIANAEYSDLGRAVAPSGPDSRGR